MGNEAEKKNYSSPESDGSSSFIVDPRNQSGEEVPSVSRLLNRKKLGLSSPSSLSSEKTRATLRIQRPAPKESVPEEAPTELFKPTSSSVPDTLPPPPPEPREITLSHDRGTESTLSFQIGGAAQEPTAASPLSSENPAVDLPLELSPSLPTSAPKAQVQVKPSKRKSSPVQALIHWDPHFLKAGVDPLGRGIAHLLKKGATHVLFLSIAPPPLGSPVPLFVATASLHPQQKLAIWTGLTWDPRIVPELWNYLIKTGQAELAPPGLMTNQNSNRNVVRGAFGIGSKEFLLLLLAGPPSACRGVVAVVSQQSLITHLDGALELLSSPAPEVKKG